MQNLTLNVCPRFRERVRPYVSEEDALMKVKEMEKENLVRTTINRKKNKQKQAKRKTRH